MKLGIGRCYIEDCKDGESKEVTKSCFSIRPSDGSYVIVIGFWFIHKLQVYKQEIG